jgi:tripartite-type tricarboxylate transporter receptor subunit TctC
MKTLFALSAALSAMAALAASGAVLAQAYPVKPVRLVVPFPGGGAMDTVARSMGARLGEALGQQVVVDNRSGAGGVIGAEVVAKSAPDGYTLVLTGGPPHIAYPFLMKSVPFDTVKDFTPIVNIGVGPQALVVHPSLGVGTLAELIAHARRNPGRVSYATPGVGTAAHLGGMLFARDAGLDMLHVGYKGGAPALNDLLGGQVPTAILVLSTVMPHVRSGKLRLLAVLDSQRARQAPDTPTLAEAGVPGFNGPELWIGVLGPAGMAPSLVAQINAAINKAIVQPELAARLEAAGFEVKGSTPQAFADYIARAYENYRRITAELGIKPE